LEKGAADYAVKDVEQFYIDLLPAIMSAAYTRYRLMSENRQQRQDLEKATLKAQAANQAKSEFLTTMSHEIRTPLNVILGVAGLLEKTVTDIKQKDMIGVLHSNATLLLGLVNDILDLSRVESGQVALEMTNFKAQQLLSEVQGLFHLEITKKNLELNVEDNTGGIIWRGDLLRVQQIVMNLVSNAIKFTEKGAVTVSAKLGIKNTLQLSVTDTGIGISKDKLEAIFSKFVQADQSITRRFGGSGLGLSLSQSFARLMHGVITVDSREGEGSTFTVTLPLQYCYSTEMDIEEPVVVPDKPVSNSESRHVLLVEDYPANVMIATLMLEEMNFEVSVASNGQEAVDYVRNADKPFHTILMDIQMQGMDGYQTTRAIREQEKTRNLPPVPIIAMTAYAMSGEAQKCIDAGMDDYISKPYRFSDLETKLSKYIKK
jgi:signal transduction histidine kinase/CheY-like chemotaxis protein